jgi:uncharacterized protein (DUF2164 family)
MIPIKLPKEQKEQIAANLQSYFELERSETLGNLEAEQLIDFMIQQLGPYLYNKAIEDARQMLLEKMAGLEEELYALQNPILHKRHSQ